MGLEVIRMFGEHRSFLRILMRETIGKWIGIILLGAGVYLVCISKRSPCLARFNNRFYCRQYSLIFNRCPTPELIYIDKVISLEMIYPEVDDT